LQKLGGAHDGGRMRFLLFGLLIGFYLLAESEAAKADSSVTPDRLSQLHDAYYDERVLEYCGGYTAEVHDGFLRRLRYLLESADIDAATDRGLKVSGWTDADSQYDDHGLGGFRHWCATDGKRAAEDFLAFRAQALSGKMP